MQSKRTDAAVIGKLAGGQVIDLRLELRVRIGGANHIRIEQFPREQQRAHFADEPGAKADGGFLAIGFCRPQILVQSPQQSRQIAIAQRVAQSKGFRVFAGRDDGPHIVDGNLRAIAYIKRHFFTFIHQRTAVWADHLHQLRGRAVVGLHAELAELGGDELLGFGPLEELLTDPDVTDIMVNGPDHIYVERGGRLELAETVFRDNAHVLNVAQRIVSAVGRRVDETSPLCDARLADGSRVNVIIPPLAIDGPSISIRKFAKQKITMEKMEGQNNLSPAMATVLRIAGRSRLNIIISGGTGSGKTTLLNALSRMIDPGERIVTIEDAAELQLQQPHVVRLETRPANLEGEGEITQRELVKNCLRMRPDRIILGEIRAGEALDMLQAMNTGHDGSLCTIHANRPREALTRLENMVAMAGVKLPNEAVRSQIAGAVNMIVQIARMRDGVRRITHITEVVGMEGEVVTTQDLFTFEFEGENPDGTLYGSFKSSGLRPAFAVNAKYFGLEKALLDAMSQPEHSTQPPEMAAE